MIENEIAKFENPLHARFSVLLVAELGEELLVVVLDWVAVWLASPCRSLLS